MNGAEGRAQQDQPILSKRRSANSALIGCAGIEAIGELVKTRLLPEYQRQQVTHAGCSRRIR